MTCADVRVEIEEALTEPTIVAAHQTSERKKRWKIRYVVAVFTVGIALGIALWNIFFSRPAYAPNVSHLAIVLAPPVQTVASNPTLDLSPDGQKLVYVGAGDTSQLYLRRLESA